MKLAAILILAVALSGCSQIRNLNPFGEREVPLQGERRPVFPPGEGITSWSQTPEGRRIAEQRAQAAGAPAAAPGQAGAAPTP